MLKIFALLTSFAVLATATETPPPEPFTEKGFFFVDAEAFFLQPQENNLNYAIKSSSSAGISNGRYQNIHFHWRPAFQTGIGYKLPNTDAWDFFCNYLYVHGKGTAHATAPTGGGLFSLWTIPSASLTASQTGHAKWNLYINRIDLETRGAFHPQNWLELRPSVGLSNAWIKQHYNINMAGAYNSQAFVTVADDQIQMKNHFWGIGPRFGLDTQWKIFQGFSFYGNGSFSLLYGVFNIHQSENVTYNNGYETNYLSVKDSFRSVQPTVEFDLGLRFTQTFSHPNLRYCVEAGWQNWIFAGQNQFYRFIEPASSNSSGPSFANGDSLALQGWKLAFLFYF